MQKIKLKSNRSALLFSLVLGFSCAPAAAGIDLYRVLAAADFALDRCTAFAEFNPKKYLALQRSWQKALVMSNGVLDLVSYEVELENLTKSARQTSEMQVFCFKRLITLSVALGKNSPFSIKGSSIE